MGKYFVLSLVLFAWGVHAQITDTITSVSVDDEVQAGMPSTSAGIPSSGLPEVTSALSVSETEMSSTAESAALGEESATESEQFTPTQFTNDEAMTQGKGSTESDIEVQNAVSGSAIQQELESDVKGGATSSQQPLTEDSTMTKQDTTSQPVASEDVIPKSEMKEETTIRSSIQKETTLQPTIQDDTTPQPVTQEETSSQPTTQEKREDQFTTQTINKIATEQEETQEEAVSKSSLDQETDRTQEGTKSPAAEEKKNPIEMQSPAVIRSAVEGGTTAVMIETEGTSTDAPAEDVTSGFMKGEIACPTNCTSATGDPICGSDQRVYENECHLKRETCGKNVTVASWELCRGKHDICPAQCLNIQDPVCGEDGKIYPNLCLMFKFNCGKRMRTFDLVRCVNTYRGFRRVDGACPKACHELYRPVCGSDGKVYSNDCYLRLQSCGRNVRAVEMSKCVDTPRCPHTCTPLYDPVCGSDGRMYLNHCYFANLNCGKNVAKVDLRFCESFQHLK